MKRKMILFNQLGNGSRYKWLCTTTDPNDLNLNFKPLGYGGSLYIGWIMENPSDAVNNMVLYLPYFEQVLTYDDNTDQFVENKDYKIDLDSYEED